MADQVELTDLDVISRWSLAVRTATADRDELIEALESDLAWLRGGRATSVGGATAPRKAASRTPRTPRTQRKSAAKKPASS